MEHPQPVADSGARPLKPPRAPGWPLERVLHLIAGTVILVSVALAYGYSSWWLWLTTFVGASLLLDAAAGWCPASVLLYRLGVRTSAECGMHSARS